MNVGDYVRNQYGIAKVIDIENNYGIDTLVLDNNICFMVDCRTGEINKDIPFFNKLPLTKNIDLNKVKSSPNIIDLIEVGDYVNGLPVERIGRTLDDENDIRVWFGVATYGRTILNQINHRYTVKDEFEDDYSLRFRCIKPEDIKSIVTREQFSQMEYKVGE